MNAIVDSINRPVARSNVSPDGKYGYIDAVRGWAILLVITTHSGGAFTELPYPVKKLTNFGWHGVQLFFLASAVTLALSWARSVKPFPQKTAEFFVRRFLRIAPMYYAGALLYTLTIPPPGGIDPAQLLRTLLFVNTWSPDWIPTTPGWMVVPGGWSIGVEFTFYALFPVLITVLTTLRRAVLFAIASIVLAMLANAAGRVWFSGIEASAVARFLYFWFPNQLPVFALGIVLYHCIAACRPVRLGVVASYCILTACVLASVLAAEIPAASDKFALSVAPPQILIISLIFAAFIFTLAQSPPTLFTHPLIRRLGVLSFSCYVLHFLFVWKIPVWTGGLIDVSAGGYRAIAMLAVLWSTALAATWVSAELCHRVIEQPGIRLAHRLTAARRSSPGLAAAG